MNSKACPNEAKVGHAARTGCWDPWIRDHIRECTRCREITEISDWVRSTAAMGEESCNLPDPERIWMHARVLAAQMARKRALRPLEIAEIIVRSALALGIMAGIAWLWYEYQPLSAYLRPSHLLLLKPLFATIFALGASTITLVFLRLVLPALSADQ